MAETVSCTSTLLLFPQGGSSGPAAVSAAPSAANSTAASSITPETSLVTFIARTTEQQHQRQRQQQQQQQQKQQQQRRQIPTISLESRNVFDADASPGVSRATAVGSHKLDILYHIHKPFTLLDAQQHKQQQQPQQEGQQQFLLQPALHLAYDSDDPQNGERYGHTRPLAPPSSRGPLSRHYSGDSTHASRGNSNWTSQEDVMLQALIEQFGTSKWSLIASRMGTKGNKQCRRRWQASLNIMGRKGTWTPEEDATLLESHRVRGNRWTEIALLLPGRTDNACKNRFSALTNQTSLSGGNCSGTDRGPSPSPASEQPDKWHSAPAFAASHKPGRGVSSAVRAAAASPRGLGSYAPSATVGADAAGLMMPVDRFFRSTWDGATTAGRPAKSSLSEPAHSDESEEPICLHKRQKVDADNISAADSESATMSFLDSGAAGGTTFWHLNQDILRSQALCSHDIADVKTTVSSAAGSCGTAGKVDQPARVLSSEVNQGAPDSCYGRNQKAQLLPCPQPSSSLKEEVSAAVECCDGRSQPSLSALAGGVDLWSEADMFVHKTDCCCCRSSSSQFTKVIGFKQKVALFQDSMLDLNVPCPAE